MLLQVAEAHRIELPRVKAYADYLSHYGDMSAAGIADELSALEKSTYASSITKTGAPRSLVEMNFAVRRHGKFWNELFAPSDWKEYQTAGLPSLVEVEQFITNYEREMGIKAERGQKKQMDSRLRGNDGGTGTDQRTTDINSPTYAQCKFIQESYYKLAFTRNNTLFHNFIRQMQELKPAEPNGAR